MVWSEYQLQGQVLKKLLCCPSLSQTQVLKYGEGGNR